MSKKAFDDLLHAHLAVVALLDSAVISSTTRKQLEAFRDQLERDIAFLKDRNVKDAG